MDPENDKLFPELRRMINGQHLLDKQPKYYWNKITSTLGALGLSIAFLVVVDHSWLQVLNAAFLALVFGQMGFLGHDAGHRSVVRSVRGE